jgi:hypothetical protein
MAGHAAALSWLHPHVFANAVNDFDTPWHLACGRIVCETGEVPRADPLCYTTDGQDWINLNWLAQAVLYRLYLSFGLSGALALATCLFAGALGFTWASLHTREAGPTASLVVLGVCTLLLTGVHGLRPRGYSFLLLAVVGWLLARPDPEHRFGWGRAVALTALLLVWNQLHGAFLYGYALVGLDALGSGLDHRQRTGRWFPRRSVALVGCALVGCAGFALHPHGFAALVHAVTYPSSLGALHMSRIQELQPLRVGSPHWWVVAGLATLGVTGCLLARRRPPWRDLVVALFFLGLTFAVRRAVIPLVLLSAPWVARTWTEALREVRLFKGLEERLELLYRSLPWALGAAVLGWLLVFVPARVQPGVPGDVRSPAWNPARFPTAAVAYLAAQDSTGRVFNEYGAGGLLGWAAYPARRVFVDGRGDLHARYSTYEDYVAVVSLQPGWRERLDEADVEYALLLRGEALTDALQEEGWPVLHADPRYLVLGRPRAEAPPDVSGGTRDR